MSKVLDRTFSQQLSEKKRKSAVKWGSLNVCFLSALYFDIHQKKYNFDEKDYFFYLECLSCLILSLSLVTNVMTFIYHSFFNEAIVCDNEEQKILLNLNNSTVKSPPKKPAPHGSIASANDTINIRNLSYSERKHDLPEHSTLRLQYFNSFREHEHEQLLAKQRVRPAAEQLDFLEYSGYQLSRGQQLPVTVQVQN